MLINVARGEQEYGPFSLDELRGYVVAGNFTPEDLVWHEDLTEWVPLRSVSTTPHVPPLNPSTATQPQQVIVTSTPIYPNAANQNLLYESQKTSAGPACALNFILPGVGYMYAGMWILGIFVFLFWGLMLTLSPVTLVISLFLAALIWLMGLIDGFLAVGRANKKIALKLMTGS
jgi:hypothetical protein